MNSRERFLAALRGEPVDRTPLAHVSALTTVQLQEMTGCFMPAVHSDPAQLAALGFANHEILGFDAVSFIINYFSEPAALGAAIEYGARDALPVYTSHPWQDAEDAACPPDLLDRSPIQVYLKTIAVAKRKYGERCAVLGKVMGPFSMVLVMHGLESLLMGLIDDEPKMTHFVETAAEVLARCANAQFEAGADAVAIGEGGAGASMLSPERYERFLLPVHRRMIRAIHGPTILHICGDITPRLGSMAAIGLTCFNFDWAISPSRMKRAAAGRFRIMGNVNTTDLLMGNPGQVERQVSECLAAGVDIISPGCAISPKCPNANLRAMHEAIARHHEE